MDTTIFYCLFGRVSIRPYITPSAKPSLAPPSRGRLRRAFVPLLRGMSTTVDRGRSYIFANCRGAHCASVFVIWHYIIVTYQYTIIADAQWAPLHGYRYLLLSFRTCFHTSLHHSLRQAELGTSLKREAEKSICPPLEGDVNHS